MAVANEVEKRREVKVSTGSSPGADERRHLRTMLLIRKFEERTYQEYTKPGQKIGGFCHLYSGQEAVAAGIAAIFQRDKDYLITAYRCHGHSLALGMSPRAGMAELFGKSTGCSKGKGGSMHFFEPSAGNMGGHGIVGGHLPVGLGLAFSQHYRGTGGVTFCLFGDGAVNQGTHNEALNMASLYKVPCIFVVENNHMAMGTPVERHSAETDLAKRAAGYNMPFKDIDGNDINVVMEEMGKAAERGRKGEGPSYIVANTYRFRGHSMSDAMKYRSKEEAERAKLRDPILVYEGFLREKGMLTNEQLEALTAEVAQVVDQATKQADADPHPNLEDRFDDILAETYPLQK